MKRAVPACLVALAACLLAVACGAKNSLGGSVSELFPLDVSRVTILRNDEAFQIDYFANHGPDEDLVARVTVATYGLNLAPGKKISLAGEYAPGHSRTTVVHIAAGEPARFFPEVAKGDLKLDSGGQAGQISEGDFSMSFEQGPYGGGRDLYGNFSAMTQDAGFGPDGGPPPP